MRRTRIKGIANIPQRKKVDLPQKAEEDGKNKTDVIISKDDRDNSNTKINQAEPSISISENIEAGKNIIKEEIIKRTINSDSENIANASSAELSSEKNIKKEETRSLDTENTKKNLCPELSAEKIELLEDIKRVISVLEPSENLDTEKIKNDSSTQPSAEKNKFPENEKKEISVLENVVLKRASDVDQLRNVPIRSYSRVGNHEAIKKKLLPLSRAIKPNISSCSVIRTVPKGVKSLNMNCNGNNSATETDMDKTSKIENNTLEGNTETEQNVKLHPPSPVYAPGIRKLKSPISGALDLRKVPSPHANAGSDSEYPIPPASPNKVNRSRIKAIPRLGYRKISFSASESEDETKRGNHRIRNDSQSSNISGIQETLTEQQPMTPKVKEFSSVIHRKCRRTEWSRKLAEARREFTRKFMSGKPDHKKLTMIDLIFYNPTTNQLKKENKTSISETKLDEKTEEDVDNPPEKEDAPPEKPNIEENKKMSDEENEVLAPQIKIGPAGEIILDEKSLIIENKETKKNREELQNSEIVDGNSDRPYGVFKKVKRSKDWSHAETLRFYKALSTIGTDFSLMCELFPQRTRRELKMKFKKEERINQTLIDKAVMEPCCFDFEELKKEFELVEIERKELAKQKFNCVNTKRTKDNGRSIKLTKFVNLKQENDAQITEKEVSIKLTKVVNLQQEQITEKETIKEPPALEVNSNVIEIVEKEDSDGVEFLIEPTQVKLKRKREKIRNPLKKVRQKKLDIISVLSDSDSINSDSESELLWRPTQTRYGRQVKRRQVYEPDSGIQEEFVPPRKIKKLDVVEQQPTNKPGSLMMVSSTTSDGQPVVQIFMVTDKDPNSGTNVGNSPQHPDNLLPIAMIKTNPSDEPEEIVENNYTIPAEPDVSLKDN